MIVDIIENVKPFKQYLTVPSQVQFPNLFSGMGLVLYCYFSHLMF